MAMRISLNPDTHKSFSFDANCKELDACLSRLGNVVGGGAAGNRSFILYVQKGKVAVIAFNTDTYAYMTLGEAAAEGDGAFGFDPQTMQGIIKGRALMSFKFTGSECEFKLVKGRYNGKFVVLPITADQATMVNSAFDAKKRSDDTTLNRDVLDALKEGVALTGIHNVYAPAESILTYLNLTSKGELAVSCFDKHHFGHYALKVEQKGVTFRIAMPSSHFQIIDRMVEGEEAKFLIRPESIRVEGTTFVLILPSTQTEDKNFSIVADYIASLDKPDLACTIDVGKLSTLIDNLFTLHAANASFDLSYKEGGTGLTVTFSTNTGSASESLKITTKKAAKALKAKVEPRIFKDILAIISGQGESSMNIKRSAWVTFVVSAKSGAVARYVCSLAD